MLHIYDTLSKEQKLFVPISDTQITMYQCGPTVYWNQHIGNMRAAVIGDLIYRGMQYLYPEYQVKFVRNYTDVGHLTGDNIGDADSGEDRMERAAKREGIDPDKIADKYIDTFESDITALHCQFPIRTRATHYIPQMISMVQTLIDQGYAYTTPLAIYFDISRKTDYTKLSGQNMDKLLSGHGHGETSDPQKKHPGDFALWFFRASTHANALQYWESPFESSLVTNGAGFPGWHIECSAMSIDTLGQTIDIHMGGIEHIPIHHTNERAQSESATGVEFVHYWMHYEHLLVDNKKMSKSEGTSYLLSDIIERGYDSLDLRYFFLQAQYRSKQNFTWAALDAAKSARAKLEKKVHTLPTGGMPLPEFIQQYTEALEDDFNIPKALAVIHIVLKTDNDPADIRATIELINQVLAIL